MDPKNTGENAKQQAFPGTDDGADVEGHRGSVTRAAEDEAGPEGHRRVATYTDDGSDVEGHRGSVTRAAEDEAGPEGHRRVATYTDDGADVEGHLYTGGPTTQGEIVRKLPGSNPHGER